MPHSPGHKRHALLLIEASGLNGLSRETLMWAAIHPMTLRTLEAALMIEPRQHRFTRPRGLAVLRYHITEAGRAALRHSEQADHGIG
jgi:hypothetical protein